MPQKNTIVYVDDDEDDRDILAEVFSVEKDYYLLALPSGEVLFKLLPTIQDDVCLLVLDINMPVENGVEVLKALRQHKQYHSIPALMLTTGGNSPHAAQLKQMGITVETKPVTFDEMRELKDRLLSHYIQ